MAALRSGTAQAVVVSGNVIASSMLVTGHIASGMPRRERRLLSVLLVASLLKTIPAADAVAAAVEVIAPATGAAIELMAVMLRGTTEILDVVPPTLRRTEMMLGGAEVMGTTPTKAATTHVLMSAAKSAAAHMVAAAPESATSVMPTATHVASTSTPASSVTMTCRQI